MGSTQVLWATSTKSRYRNVLWSSFPLWKRDHVHRSMESRHYNLIFKNFLKDFVWILCARAQSLKVSRTWQGRTCKLVLMNKWTKIIVITLKFGSKQSWGQSTTQFSNISCHQIKQINWFLISRKSLRYIFHTWIWVYL